MIHTNKPNLKNLYYLFIAVIFSVLLTSCATIVGGSKYWAKVQVPGHPNAKIEYNGIYQGTGEASFKAKRSEANEFEVTIKEDGCETETKRFTQRDFRVWAFIGTLVTFTGIIINGVWLPVPFGVMVDGSVGSWWKPDTSEKGVSKEDFKHFTYLIDYTGCKNKKPIEVKQQEGISTEQIEKLKELKKLLDDGILNQEEFEKEKKKVLDE